MADTMQFDLVSPERMLVSTQASEVQIPAAEGDLTVMTGHTPVITTLRPGILKVMAAGQTSEFAVTGGFAEVSPEGVTIMAERALPRAEMTSDVMNDWVAEAREVHSNAHPTVADAAAKLLSDMVAMGGHIGLN